MVLANENFTISCQETLLLPNDQQPKPKKTRMRNLKLIILFSLLILFILIAGSMILSSIHKKNRKPNAYLSGSARYYCNLTPYSQLCHTSMSSIINTTALKSNPSTLFATSLQVVINHLNNTAISITKALSSPNPHVQPRLSKCQELVQDSLARLNKSLGLLGDNPDIESFTFKEMDDFRAWTRAGLDKVGKCFMALEEIDAKMGVEEVKLGVETANNLIANSIWLINRRYLIIYDFYNPEGDYYNYGNFYIDQHFQY